MTDLLLKAAFNAQGLTFGKAAFEDVRFSNDDTTYNTVLVTYLPYYFPMCDGANICKYAALPDYHKAFAEKLDSVAKKLKESFPDNVFDVFVDKSPVDEKKAAIIAGLGVKGVNSLFITRNDGSFVFLGSICTDMRLPTDGNAQIDCEKCGQCVRQCPVHALDSGYLDITKCLSAVTQRKGILTPEEEEAIRNSGVAWGCDICQNVCPHNARLLDKFSAFAEANRDNLITRLTPEDIENMTEKQFQSHYKNRAFIWRGRKTLLRNLKIVCKEETSE